MTQATMVHALNTGLRRAMEDDPAVMLMGEDIGALGGVFRVTDGLAKDFGDQRVLDTPLAEAGIVGTAIGLAMRGLRPVCEMQFDGFSYPAMDQIFNQLAKMPARSSGMIRLPVVIRIPCGGGIGAIEHHSESPEAYYAHTAGLRVVACSNPQDAHDMIRQAIACDDPVIFFEPKRRYWEKGELDPDHVPQPLFTSRIARPGRDATVVTHGGGVALALRSAEVATEDGLDIEVIDLRSLSPLDIGPVVESVRRTGHLVVVQESAGAMSVASEVAAQVSERAFYSLEAPVLRVCGYDLPYPPARMEKSYLPDVDRILDAVDRSLAF